MSESKNKIIVTGPGGIVHGHVAIMTERILQLLATQGISASTHRRREQIPGLPITSAVPVGNVEAKLANLYNALAESIAAECAETLLQEEDDPPRSAQAVRDVLRATGGTDVNTGKAVEFGDDVPSVAERALADMFNGLAESVAAESADALLDEDRDPLRVAQEARNILGTGAPDASHIGAIVDTEPAGKVTPASAAIWSLAPLRMPTKSLAPLVKSIVPAHGASGGRQRLLQYPEFSAGYLVRLKIGDIETEQHFNAYFSNIIWLKLRNRVRAPHLIDEIRQETFTRVMNYLKSGKVIQYPERFGVFVLSVCNNVMLEVLRSESQQLRPPGNLGEPSEERVRFDTDIVVEERKRMVREALAELSAKDSELLRMVFLEEGDRSAISRHFSVDNDYLRVLLHRAKERFRDVVRNKGVACQSEAEPFEEEFAGCIMRL